MTETGNCYQMAGRFMMDYHLGVAEFGQIPRDAVEAIGEVFLVHGRPTLAIPPHCKYGHAWIEIHDRLCYDVESNIIVPADLFYSVGQVERGDQLFRYNNAAFRRIVSRFDHWGPWEGIEAQGIGPAR